MSDSVSCNLKSLVVMLEIEFLQHKPSIAAAAPPNHQPILLKKKALECQLCEFKRTFNDFHGAYSCVGSYVDRDGPLF